MTAKPTRRAHRSHRTLVQFEAFAGVLQAAETLQRGLTELLKTEDLSVAQYNVLRILRGADSEGLTCGEVGGQLIRHDPDVTRLVDRLLRRGLVARTREQRDRRVVRTRITDKGLELLERLDDSVDQLHEQQLGHMDERQLTQLSGLLMVARTRLPG